MILFGLLRYSARACCRLHFALLTGYMDPVDFCLMAVLGERVPVGVA